MSQVTAPAAWPPPDGERIGEELARELVAWMREIAPPVLAEAEAMLREHIPDAELSRGSLSASQLAGWALASGMSGINLGTVWGAGGSSVWMMVDIILTREGELVALPGYGMRRV